MTDDEQRLAQIAARLAKLTGRYHYRTRHEDSAHLICVQEGDDWRYLVDPNDLTMQWQDQDFIFAAPDDEAYLLDRVRAAEDFIARLGREAFGGYHGRVVDMLREWSKRDEQTEGQA